MSKEVRINIRSDAATVADLKTTARLRGISVSSLVNLLVVKAIREEKAVAPEEFENGLSKRDEQEIRESGIRRGRGNWRKALERVKGMWKDRDDLPDFEELRRSWDRNVWDDDK